MENQKEEVEITTEIPTSYEDLSELNDMKQHADKIIQGIKKLEEKDANRAIWELFQNAVDLSEECEITIKHNEDSIEFSHNGEPFTPMTLDCLFKQVSSKTLEEKKLEYTDNEPVGQYGTGFITSHSFGKKIIINGALIKDDGYVLLEDFIIDRHTDNWKELGQKIRLLKKEVSRLLKEGIIKEPPYPNTTFTYKTITTNNKDRAKKAIESLRNILPYVLTISPRLKKVTVEELSGKTTVYKKNTFSVEGKLHSTSILINEEEDVVYYLKSNDNKLTIILPFSDKMVAKDLSESLPRLYLYYPLVGTQDLGINYLIHSRHFQPNEPRSGLYLKSNNEDNQKEEEANQKLIQTASNCIFEFIKENSSIIKNPIKLARINYKVDDSDKPLLNDYFQSLKASWINKFKSFPIVETRAGNILVSNTVFIDPLLQNDDPEFDSIFKLVDFFWENTPIKRLSSEWTAIISEWQHGEINYIGFKDIADKIKAVSNLEGIPFVNELKVLYSKIIKEGHGDLFSTHELLPNIKGEFRLLSGLNNNINLPTILIDIADVIMPDIPKRHINNDFKFSLDLNPYNRKNYTADINTAISLLIKDKTLSSEITSEILYALIKYSKITSSSDSTSVPIKLVKLICDFYQIDNNLIEIQLIKEDELDVRSPQRKLIRLFLNDLSHKDSEWVSENIAFLKSVLEIGPSYYDYEEMFNTLSVFPNQLTELSIQSYLTIDSGIPNEIKDLYDKVVKPSFPIRANLVHIEFERYLKNKDKKSIRSLTEKIESEFFENSQFTTIEQHQFKEDIINLIQKFKTSAEHEKYFPVLFGKRSSILVELADGDDSFSILSLDPSKIKKLAILGQNPNIDEIIRLGQEALIKQHQDNANFQHKYKIGTHIEKVLRLALKSVIPSSIEAEVKDVQDGQDIVISINKTPYYYIEVKSRWDSNSSIKMSKNQTLRANEQKDNYSLCSIDMSKYEGENRYEVESIDEIKHLIKFNTNIGDKVIHLVEVLNQTNEPNTIHLDGEYRTLIPQTYIDTGNKIADFESYLITYLSQKVETE